MTLEASGHLAYDALCFVSLIFSPGPKSVLGGPELHALAVLPQMKEQPRPTEEKDVSASKAMSYLRRSKKLLSLLGIHPQFPSRPALSQATQQTKVPLFQLYKLQVVGRVGFTRLTGHEGP
jgi:hypothetical protein